MIHKVRHILTGLFILTFLSLSNSVSAQLNNEVLILVNQVRTDPERFLNEQLLPYLKIHSINTRDSRSLIRTLKNYKPTIALKQFSKLDQMAQDYADEAGSKGWINHRKTGQRFKNYAPEMEFTGENLQFGLETAMDIVIDLLIDEGVPDHGHRKNILDENFQYFGFGFAPHKNYDTISVLLFGGKVNMD